MPNLHSGMTGMIKFANKSVFHALKKDCEASWREESLLRLETDWKTAFVSLVIDKALDPLLFMNIFGLNLTFTVIDLAFNSCNLFGDIIKRESIVLICSIR